MSVTSKQVDESIVEEMALEELAGLHYRTMTGADLPVSDDSSTAMRSSYREVILLPLLRQAVARLNPQLPLEAREEVVNRVVRLSSAGLVAANQEFHGYLTDGLDIEYRDPAREGLVYAKAYLLDYSTPANNDWLAVNQFTVASPTSPDSYRLDLVVFVNGLPLFLFEFKNPFDQAATVLKAYNQFQTYKAAIPDLFRYNVALVISDGVDSRVGTLTARFERFQPWRSLTGDEDQPLPPRLPVLIRGFFLPARLLDITRSFVVFEQDRGGGAEPNKKLAAYHQYFATNKAVTATVEASTRPAADPTKGKAGVIWHTQGSGKSLTMVFYAGKLVQQPAMQNPTIIVLTDRNDLDDQLFSTFVACRSLLRQTPVQAESREHLRQLLQVQAGGIIFTTIQKFAPLGSDEATDNEGNSSTRRNSALSLRDNIVFMADEAHRSQYNFKPKTQAEAEKAEAELRYGLAQHMRDALPNATFIGFTGTPVESADRSTSQVFGGVLDTYDIQRSIEDKATVPIYYQFIHTPLGLDEEERAFIDSEFEEVTEGQEATTKEKLKTRWSSLEALAGTPARLKTLARQIVEHFESRQATLEGKALVVCMSRDICASLYNELVALRPQWHSDDDKAGIVKVVITGSSADEIELQRHIRTKRATRDIAERFKDPADPLKVVIVRDMWLTGFDVPPLHTMYVDKPMRDQNLMQAIARVNRVYLDKPGGLIVDFIGISTALQSALERYSYSPGDKLNVGIDQTQAVAFLKTQLGKLRDLFHGFDYSSFTTATPGERFRLVLDGLNYVLGQPITTTAAGAGSQGGGNPEGGANSSGSSGSSSNGGQEGAGDGETEATVVGSPALPAGILGGPGGGADAEGGIKTRPEKRFLDLVASVNKAYALAVPNPEAVALGEEIAFFQAVRQSLLKTTVNGALAEEVQTDQAVREIVSNSVVARGVVDIFEAAGLAQPNVALFSDEFLEGVRDYAQERPNLAIEALRKLLSDEVRERSKVNLFRYRSFARKLEESINSYNNQALDTAALLNELITMAREIKEKTVEGERLNLNPAEVAFYDALAENESARQALADQTLQEMARELLKIVQNNATLDWQIKESVRARLRVLVKRLLNKYDYPPDKREEAVVNIIKQAERLGQNESSQG